MSKRYHFVTASVLCLTLTTACGSSGSIVGGLITVARAPGGQLGEYTSPPDDFKRIGSDANGVTVAVPHEWVAHDLTKGDIEEFLERSGLSGKQKESLKKDMQAMADVKAILAIDPKSSKASPNRFATNLNAFCQPGRSSAEELMDANTKGLEEFGAKVSEATKVRIAGGEAARILYTLPAGNVKVKGTQFHVPTSDTVCTVTLSTDQDNKQKLFDQIGATISPL
ncbi:hypothetical protein [Nonomuraea africana]|uniref:Lipoprotein n=1 Tax=Nonomuraea africana TaxID=46171 RepID=A0ABR9K8F2_9ACTN|nr:hypothetical protein [Nonomuraea africana]MBE1558287.1 hypothetical protein [Nonomuraea africana]